MKARQALMTSEEKARLCAQVADGKKAEDIVVSFVREQIRITDYFVVCTVTNRRQMKAVAAELQKIFKEKGIHALGVEGQNDSGWVLVDYDDVIVHMFEPEQREYYALDILWGDAPAIDWQS